MQGLCQKENARAQRMNLSSRVSAMGKCFSHRGISGSDCSAPIDSRLNFKSEHAVASVPVQDRRHRCVEFSRRLFAEMIFRPRRARMLASEVVLDAL
jgi:hypothetical protein